MLSASPPGLGLADPAMEVPGTPPVAGSCWQDPLAVAGTTGRPVCGTRGRAGRQRVLSVVCVLGREPAACPALRSLRDACRGLRARLHTLPFGTLALGDPDTLDRFYNAGEDAGDSQRGVSIAHLFLLFLPGYPSCPGVTGPRLSLFPVQLPAELCQLCARVVRCLLFCLPLVYFPGWLDICWDVFSLSVKHVL